MTDIQINDIKESPERYPQLSGQMTRQEYQHHSISKKQSSQQKAAIGPLPYNHIQKFTQTGSKTCIFKNLNYKTLRRKHRGKAS